MDECIVASVLFGDRYVYGLADVPGMHRF